MNVLNIISVRQPLCKSTLLGTGFVKDIRTIYLIQDGSWNSRKNTIHSISRLVHPSKSLLRLLSNKTNVFLQRSHFDYHGRISYSRADKLKHFYQICRMATSTSVPDLLVDETKKLTLHDILDTPQKEEQKSRSKTPGKGKYKNHTNSPKPTFPSLNCEAYWPRERVSAGLKRGEVFEGIFRINERNYERAYISLDDGKNDILVKGLVHRNRALHGDRVVVKLLPKEEWEKTDIPDIMLPACDGNKDSKSPDKLFELVKTGKVVYISEEKHPRVTSGYLKPFYNNYFGCAHFIPLDSKVPRIYIPIGECPEGFVERPQDFESILFIVRIVEWRKKFKLATGQLMRSLGEAGEIEPETEALLAENGINDKPFSDSVLDCLPSDIPWKIPVDELKTRRDFRDHCVFSIDPPTARDLDDALSIRKLDSGDFEVGVHIADVSYFVTENTALDEAAKERATSVYLVQKVVPMLPRLLCEELCSLNPGVDRLTFSVLWTLSPAGHILSEWFGRSVIRSCGKFSYTHAQDMINHDGSENLELEHFPTIYGDHSLEKICRNVQQLWSVAQNLKKERYINGALKLDQPKVSFSLDSDTGLPNGCAAYQYKESNMMIEEYMLLANMAVAHQILRGNSKLAFLRRHPKPDQKLLDVLSTICSKMGVPIDCSDSGALQLSLKCLREAPPKEFSQSAIVGITMLAAKSMKLAKYFCAGALEDQELYRHYALNVPLYTHFTSPIRRYPDVIVHRLLQASLDNKSSIDKSVEQLQIIAEHCNDKKLSSKRAQERSSELFFQIYVRECGPIFDEGIVVSVLDKAIDVISCKFGIVKRIYTDKLPLKDKNFLLDNGQPCLHLSWPRAEESQSDQAASRKDAASDGSSDIVMQTLKHLSKVRIAVQSDKDKIVYILQQPEA